MTAAVSLSKASAFPQRNEVLSAAGAQAAANSRGLLELLATVQRYRIPAPSGRTIRWSSTTAGGA